MPGQKSEKPSLSTHGKFERSDLFFVYQLADDAASSMAIHVTSEVVFIYNRDSFRRQLFDAVGRKFDRQFAALS